MAVINVRNWPAWAVAILYALFGMSLPLMAAILPEERADILYHRYEGDGVTVDGPSYMARKNFGKSTSAYANYYTDSVTSASIDVVTSGSEYKEDREEYSLGADYLIDNSTISFGYTNSEENDYTSNTYHFGISHNMFSDLTTVSVGFSFADDEIRRNLRDADGNIVGNDPTFGTNGKEELKKRNYRLGLTQILTKNLILNLAFEAITDEGYTQNPYRVARIYTATDVTLNGVRIPGFQQENYPDVRTSDALAVRANYYLPYRAALHAEYKYYTDTWGLKAQSYKIKYVHPYQENWVFDVSYRFYTQDQADFYKDVYGETETNLLYYGRDKELSTYSSHAYGFGISYEFQPKGWWQINRGSVNFAYEFIDFEFENFTAFDTRPEAAIRAGDEFLFDGEVVRLFFSVWY